MQYPSPQPTVLILKYQLHVSSLLQTLELTVNSSFVLCKVVLFHFLLSVLSVVSCDKCGSKLADESGCSGYFWSIKWEREFCHSVSTVKSTVGKQSISCSGERSNWVFAGTNIVWLSWNPPMRQCSLFSVLPNIQVVAVSSMLPGCCLDTSYVFPENKSLHYFYIYYLILTCSHLVNKVKLTTISLSLKKITGVIFTCPTYLIASNLRIVLVWTLDKCFVSSMVFAALDYKFPTKPVLFLKSWVVSITSIVSFTACSCRNLELGWNGRLVSTQIQFYTLVRLFSYNACVSLKTVQVHCTDGHLIQLRETVGLSHLVMNYKYLLVLN